MKRRRAGDDRLTYIYIAILNICVVGMFLVILTPAPTITRPIEASAVTIYTSPQKKIKVQSPIVGTANRIVVPSVGIDTAVREGSYDGDKQTWDIDHHSAFHADITVPVNNANGTTLLYGHAGWGIFAPLPKVTNGAEAYVYTSEGYRFDYTFASSRRVDPDDVSILTSTGPPQLVLQTCSGAFDSYRTLVTFHYKEVVRSE
ncbi:MAG: sortase [Candidatus Saccharimonadaceae bacterium]